MHNKMANLNFDTEFLIDKTILEKTLISQIHILEKFKFEMQNYIKQAINLIESQLYHLISSINCSINSHLDLLGKNNDMSESTYRNHEIFSKVLEIRKPNIDNFLNLIIEYFSNCKIIFNTDSKLKLIKKKSKFLTTHNSSFNCLAISNNDKFLVTGSIDTSVRIWDLENFGNLACLLNHQSSVTCLAISDDSLNIVSGSLDRTLVLWDLENKTCKHIFEGHTGAIYCACFCSDKIISGSGSAEIFFWDRISGKLLNAIYNDGIVRCCLGFENTFILGIKSRIEIWSLVPVKLDNSISAHESAINCVAKTEDGSLLITCSSDKSIKIWNMNSSSLLATLLGHSKSVNSISVSSSGDLLASGSDDLKIILWNLNTYSIINSLKLNNNIIKGVKISKDFIVTISQDSQISLISPDSFELVSYLKLETFKSGSETYKNNFIGFGQLNDVIIYDSDLNSDIIRFKGHTGPVQVVCISHSLDLALSSSKSLSENLIVWDLNKKEKLFELNGHDSNVTCIDLSLDSLHALSGDAKGRIFYWDLATQSNFYLFRSCRKC